MAEVLTREVGMAKLITPTGRQLGVVKHSMYPGLLEIKYVDGITGDLPDDLKGSWTKRDWAEAAIQNYLTKFWNVSDAAATKSAK